MRRRDLVRGAGVTVAAALVAPRARAAESLIELLDRPQDLATPLSAFDRLITPTELFFVRSHFGLPGPDRGRRLRVAGGKTPLDLGLDELGHMKQVSVTAVLQCAGNGRGLHRPRVPGLQWEFGACGQAEWRGPRLADVLARAGVAPGAGHLRLEAADRPPAPTVPAFIRSIPLARAFDPSTILATHMNGAPLTLAHGAPVRLVVPGWTGQHWVKWLTGMRAQPDEAEGFYYQTGYRIPRAPVSPGAAVKPADTVPVTTINVKSVIARPAHGDRLAAGPAEVVGVAFSGEAAVARVEVTLDGGGRWSEARLHGAPGPGRWQVFRLPFVAKAGARHTIRARASDRAGQRQPETAVWNPSGYLWNAWHTVEVTVA